MKTFLDWLLLMMIFFMALGFWIILFPAHPALGTIGGIIWGVLFLVKLVDVFIK